MSDTKYCEGCADDFYNGKNPMGVKECWLLKNATVVKRYKIGWWTPPTSREAFTEVTTHHCNRAPGVYALEAELPMHLRGASGEPPV